jgi:ribosomal protein S18 acetylase RimI-like enzyme
VKIRPYQVEDDPALMMLERQCPRGEPEPFVHYRRRFVERAELFREHFVLVIETKETIVAVAAAAIKETQIHGHPIRLAYIFDVRVSPAFRRNGLAQTLIESLEGDLQGMGCQGSYAHIVATNRPSMNLFTRLGYTRQRQLRYLTYQPLPLFLSAPIPVERNPCPDLPEIIQHYSGHDLFVDDVSASVQPHDFERWVAHQDHATISLYDQSQLFQQIPAAAPWPTPEEMARRGRHWRLFHPLGPPATLEALFATIRDEAVGANVNKLTMLADAQDPIPAFFYAETDDQREYVVVTRPFTPPWDGTFGPHFYCDTREL